MLTIGRTITRTSATAITRTEVRITSLSEVNRPPDARVTTQPPTPAQFRVINPAAPTTQITITDGQIVTVQNLSVDAPAPSSAPDRQSRARQPAAPLSQLLYPGMPSRYAIGHGTLP